MVEVKERHPVDVILFLHGDSLQKVIKHGRRINLQASLL